ncbi:helix-turn-helix domain-containing protein [Aureivirga marina]|uniref:helix-turn-helix domain-containing protein n=1 Tax=Aureivirga marina TaxID=1182451 RepID=UPI0018CB70BA|nr:helix-turn-helix domain-containing protein [Aureivirga marina]
MDSKIKDLLSKMNLEKYQKHSDFHILKLEEHLEEIPLKLNFENIGCFEITFAQSQDTQIGIDQKNIDADKDHLLFLSPSQGLNVDSSKAKNIKNTFILYFTPDFLDFISTEYLIIKKFPFFNIHFSSVFYTKKEVSEMYIHYMERIYNEFQDLNENSEEIIKAFLKIILFETKRKLEKKLHIIPQKLSRKAEITYQFENLILQSKQKNQKVSFYAEKLNVSPIYLSECVKNTVGKNAKNIITEYILLEAKSLLKNSDESIQNISLTLGFKDTSNFINFYKKHKKITPNQERKSN